MSQITQCQCCANPLGQPIALGGARRIVCNQCVGFMLRWLGEMNAEGMLPAQPCTAARLLYALADHKRGLIETARIRAKNGDEIAELAFLSAAQGLVETVREFLPGVPCVEPKAGAPRIWKSLPDGTRAPLCF